MQYILCVETFANHNVYIYKYNYVLYAPVQTSFFHLVRKDTANKVYFHLNIQDIFYYTTRMMMSQYGNPVDVVVPLWGDILVVSLKTVKQAVELRMISYAMPFMWCHCNYEKEIEFTLA